MFELNDDLDVTIKKVGPENRTVVIVDNFYKNPDKIRKLVFSSKRNTDEDLIQGLSGSRVFHETSEIKNKLKSFFDEYFLDKTLWKNTLNRKQYEENWDRSGFLCNIMNYDGVFHAPWFNIPHQDSYKEEYELGPICQFGVVIYLNTPKECAGGTNLYSYKGMMSVPFNVSKYIDVPEEMYEEVKMPEQAYPWIRKWLYANTEWKVEYEAEMVYNRCVFYEAEVIHSANIGDGMFTEHDRINQVLFL